MADELDVLVERVTDPSLRAQLRAEIDKVRAKRTFGLVFESHLPERVTLPDHPVRRGASVVRRGRTTFPAVDVDIERVRASGLIKDEIGLDEPDEKGAFSTTLLREAVKRAVDYDRRWTDYAATEGGSPVEPVLVVQVADKATEAHLSEMVGVIESEWPGLGQGAIAHVFGEHERLTLGARVVPWVAPESIEGDRSVRVVLAKTAISTGWDCPRAEVLYSERPASDATLIAQVLGRMVRSPLAQRISTDDTLNSVACYLPKFDRDALHSIKDELEGNGKSGAEGRVCATVVRAPQVFGRNPSVPADAFELIETLPSIPAPDVLANPLRRAKVLATLLTDTSHGAALQSGAGADLTKRLNKKLDGLFVQFADEVAASIDNIEHADLARGRFAFDGGGFRYEEYRVATHPTDVVRECRKIVRSVREGAGMDYWKHRVDNATADADPVDVLVDTAALHGPRRHRRAGA